MPTEMKRPLLLTLAEEEEEEEEEGVFLTTLGTQRIPSCFPPKVG